MPGPRFIRRGLTVRAHGFASFHGGSIWAPAFAGEIGVGEGISTPPATHPPPRSPRPTAPRRWPPPCPGGSADHCLDAAPAPRTASALPPSAALDGSGAWKSQPCAAASNSMPITAVAFSTMPIRPARAVGGHRDVVLLVGRSRDGIDAGRVGFLLVLGNESGRRHLRDHEAGVQARFGRQEGRHSGQCRDRPAWRSGARRSSRSRRRQARSCRLRRRPARRENCRPTARCPSSIGKDQRIVGDAVGLGAQCLGSLAQHGPAPRP
jgi:hypothetical protein